VIGEPMAKLYSFKLGLDYGGFVAGARASRSELSALRRHVDNSIPAYYKLARTQDLLSAEFDKGRLSAQKYEAAISDLSREAKAMEWQEGLLAKSRNFGMGLAAAGAGMTAAFGGAGIAALKSAADFEQTTISFSTLLGSAEEAQTTLKRLSDFAAKTPFEMPEIEQAAKQLVAFGERGDGLMETMKMLGDVSAGTGMDYSELASIFNQVRGAGKLLTQDFRQLASRGAISLRDIAGHFGVADDAAQKMMTDGKVGFDDLREILAGLTRDGGRFADMTVKQSESLTGLYSTFKDSIGIGLRQIGTELLPVAKSVTSFGIRSVEAFSEMDAGTRKAIAGTIALGAATGTAMTAIGGVMTVAGSLANTYANLQKSAMGARVAQLSLNSAIGVGYVAAAAAAAGAGYALGKSLYSLTEDAEVNARALQDLRVGVDSLGAVQFDNVNQADLEKYAQATERQIEKIKRHNAELAKSKAWWNFWQKNADLLQVNNAQIEQLQKNLAAAKTAMVKGDVSIGGVEEAAADQDKLADSLARATDKFEDEIAKLKWSADQYERYVFSKEAAALRLKGATETEIESLRKLRDERDRLQRHQEQRKEFEQRDNEMVQEHRREQDRINRENEDRIRREQEEQQREQEQARQTIDTALEEIKSPEEKVQERIAEYEKWWTEGLNGVRITYDQFVALKRKAEAELEKPITLGQVGVEAFQAGSSEAMLGWYQHELGLREQAKSKPDDLDAHLEAFARSPEFEQQQKLERTRSRNLAKRDEYRRRQAEGIDGLSWQAMYSAEALMNASEPERQYTYPGLRFKPDLPEMGQDLPEMELAFREPEVDDLQADVVADWELSAPRIDDQRAWVKANWAIGKPPEIDDLAAGVNTKWEGVPKPPTVADMTAGIVPQWGVVPDGPSVGLNADINSAWRGIGTPPPVPDRRANIVPEWREAQIPSVPDLAGRIMAEWIVQKVPRIESLKTRIGADWEVGEPKLAEIREPTNDWAKAETPAHRMLTGIAVDPPKIKLEQEASRALVQIANNTDKMAKRRANQVEVVEEL